MNKITMNQLVKSFHLVYILWVYLQACMHAAHVVVHALAFTMGFGNHTHICYAHPDIPLTLINAFYFIP